MGADWIDGLGSMIADEGGVGYGLCDALIVEKCNGEGGGSRKPVVLRKLGVPKGEGRSGSIRRFAERDVKKASVAD